MSETKNDGGPAFPQHLLETRDGGFETSADAPQGGGMSMRDYFAAKALIGFMSADRHYDVLLKEDLPNLAADCYAIADAMLKARET